MYLLHRGKAQAEFNWFSAELTRSRRRLAACFLISMSVVAVA